MKTTVYMDNAATTKLTPGALAAMMPYLTDNFGNPNSIYSHGATALRAVNEARKILAGVINVKPNEIYFTAGGTEADNWAIKATMEAYAKEGGHIITSTTEHHAVLHTCEYMEKKGHAVTYVPVDEQGIIRLDELEKAIRADTVLISVCFANNEIGSIQPIREIGRLARSKGILFHTDAVQAFCHLPIDAEEYCIDMLSASAHKLGGPKGVGFLYIRSGLKLGSFIHGGAQERGRRAGTGNVPAIVGFGAAAAKAVTNMAEKQEKVAALRDYLIERIGAEIPHCRLNGDATRRLPGNVNFSFRFIEGEGLLISLDMKGIAASSGSACTSGSLDPSHVLLAIGLPHEIAHGSLRLSLCEENTREEADFVVSTLKEIVARLRDMSPLYEDMLKTMNEKP